MTYNLNFIKQKDFEAHVENTIDNYIKNLKPYDLLEFNKNVIDPIKLLFDKNIYGKSFDEIIKDEIQRQRDKSDTNGIGYFHQNIFKYINNCNVPKEGWDVIYTNGNKKIYVEMKNKHNTMNSSSSQKTYIRMQNQILAESSCFCYLVEALAPKSRDIIWETTVDKVRCSNSRIRRVSIDKFYKEVTGTDDAFYQLCEQLPDTIETIIKKKSYSPPKDTVMKELDAKHVNTLKALYLLAFETYEGFEKL